MAPDAPRTPSLPTPGRALRDLYGVLPAAGRGLLSYPYTATIPKSLLEVDGVPLIERNLHLMREQLGLGRVRIVLGHRGDAIRSRYGDGRGLGLVLEYVENPRVDLELAHSLYLATRDDEAPCCVILPDECYLGSNHAELLASVDAAALATCGLVVAEHPKQVRKNYAVDLDGTRITRIEEKPAYPRGRLMGTGTWVLHPDLLAALRAAFEPDPARGPRGWTAWLDGVCAAGGDVRAFTLRGAYVNVNSRDDLNRANCLVRDATFSTKRTSLVYVVNGPEARAAAVDAFAERPEIDEVVVATRAPLVPPPRDPKVRTVVTSPDAGVGTVVRAGFDAARGDILLLVDSDEHFTPRDVTKFMVYLRDADVVLGTRTTRQLLEQATNMRGIVRAAHLVLARALEVLWWRFDPRLTDICCIYRACWRATWDAVRPRLTSASVEIYPEFVVEAMRARHRIVEIPVTYANPDPRSAAVRSRYQTVGTFARVLRMMLAKRVRGARQEAGAS